MKVEKSFTIDEKFINKMLSAFENLSEKGICNITGSDFHRVCAEGASYW